MHNKNAYLQNILMEDMSIAKDTAERMKGEDLRYAYDAVRVANKSVSFCSPHVHQIDTLGVINDLYYTYHIVRFQVPREAAVVSESAVGAGDIRSQDETPAGTRQ